MNQMTMERLLRSDGAVVLTLLCCGQDLWLVPVKDRIAAVSPTAIHITLPKPARRIFRAGLFPLAAVDRFEHRCVIVQRCLLVHIPWFMHIKQAWSFGGDKRVGQ